METLSRGKTPGPPGASGGPGVFGRLPRGWGDQNGCSLLRRGATTGVTMVGMLCMTEPVLGILRPPSPSFGLVGIVSAGATVVAPMAPPQPQLPQLLPQPESQQSLLRWNRALRRANRPGFSQQSLHELQELHGAGAQQVGAGAGQQTGLAGAQHVCWQLLHESQQLLRWNRALMRAQRPGRCSQQLSVAQPQPPPQPPPPQPPPIGADTTGAWAGGVAAGAPPAGGVAGWPASHAVVSMRYAAFTIIPPGDGRYS